MTSEIEPLKFRLDNENCVCRDWDDFKEALSRFEAVVPLAIVSNEFWTWLQNVAHEKFDVLDQVVDQNHRLWEGHDFLFGVFLSQDRIDETLISKVKSAFSGAAKGRKELIDYLGKCYGDATGCKKEMNSWGTMPMSSAERIALDGTSKKVENEISSQIFSQLGFPRGGSSSDAGGGISQYFAQDKAIRLQKESGDKKKENTSPRTSNSLKGTRTSESEVGCLIILLKGQKREIGIVHKRGGGGWSVELNAQCSLSSVNMYYPQWCMYGVNVNEDALNHAYPYVEFSNGEKIPVCVRFNVFGDYKFYCEKDSTKTLSFLSAVYGIAERMKRIQNESSLGQKAAAVALRTALSPWWL